VFFGSFDVKARILAVASPTLFVFDFEFCGPNNVHRNRASVPRMVVGRYRMPREIVSRLDGFCSSKRRFRRLKKQNMRRNRPFISRRS
jgi:hypothetical protein